MEARDHILEPAPTVLFIDTGVELVITRGHNNGSEFLGDELVLLIIVDGIGWANLGTDAAQTGRKVAADFGVDHRYIRHGLGKGFVYGSPFSESQLPLMGRESQTLINTLATSGTLGFINVARLLSDGDVKVSNKPLNIDHLRIGHDLDSFVLG